MTADIDLSGDRLNRVGAAALVPHLLRELAVDSAKVFAAAGVGMDAFADPDALVPIADLARVVGLCGAGQRAAGLRTSDRRSRADVSGWTAGRDVQERRRPACGPARADPLLSPQYEGRHRRVDDRKRRGGTAIGLAGSLWRRGVPVRGRAHRRHLPSHARLPRRRLASDRGAAVACRARSSHGLPPVLRRAGAIQRVMYGLCSSPRTTWRSP